MAHDAQLLALWEAAVGARGAPRDRALLGGLPRSLAERNRLALQRYADLFGTDAELIGRCAQCGTAVEFTIDARHCVAALPAPGTHAADDDPQWHTLDGHDDAPRFRLPTPEDLYALEGVDEPEAFADALLARCVEGNLPAAAETREAIGARMQALMPGATLDFSLQCPDCRHAWEAPLDPVELLWRVLRARAERLLSDVALIAQRFGWCERDILALGPVRRAAYLQLAGG
ncbi:hypothetical protein FZO89_16560 [Luteimonas viscosa]|uniref:T4 bacteriophage base plate protein n=1 Tax=Luteimonas viscosa TaxID=1132694 RepID=A0A5D4XGT2_9GAMM|nr:hypothetical protein [Luteimonas viscosa]TYT23828.1 hypothetical protein FZO89_16560 [Luteimonas viscosa]